MTEHHLSQPDFKTEKTEAVLRIVSCILTVGLLIVLPVLKILGLA
jgi:hypothetical protein